MEITARTGNRIVRDNSRTVFGNLFIARYINNVNGMFIGLAYQKVPWQADRPPARVRRVLAPYPTFKWVRL